MGSTGETSPVDGRAVPTQADGRDGSSWCWRSRHVRL